MKTKTLIQTLIALFLMTLGLNAFADPPSFTTLTAAVDFSTVISSVLTVFAALAGVYIVMKGGRMILGSIKR